jgi:hypothetical protein
MTRIKPTAGSASAALLFFFVGQTLPLTTSARAQAVTATPTFNLRIQGLRANAPRHPAERGEVPLEALRKMGAGSSKPGLALNRYLSIFVSDVDTTKAIKFSEVMDQLVSQSGDTQLTKQVLFSQWWDSAGQGPGLGLGPHCDDDTPPTPASGIANETATSNLNNFPYRCPRLEETEATNDPFTNEVDTNPKAYSAIAFSNRFDLVSPPVDAPNYLGQVLWPDCGEYRIVFARNSGKTDPLNRNLIIFEARVPNPDPKPEKKEDMAPVGCLPIVEFWHSLSDPQLTAEQRGTRLHEFYLKGTLSGTASIKPVVAIANYAIGSGQIRTNQFMLNSDTKPPTPPFDWTLREFKALELNGTLVIIPDSVKSNPGSALFAVGATDPRTISLSQDIRAQMKKILGIANDPAKIDDVNAIGFSTTGQGVNAFESDESQNTLGDIMVTFDPGNVVPSTRTDPFFTNIRNALALALPGTSLTPLNVIDRVRTQTCAGCHQYSDGSVDLIGLGGKAVWPNKRKGDLTGPTDKTNHPPMPFTQQSEKDTDLREAISASDNGKKGNRYAISTTVECLLDAREAFMKTALGLSDPPGSPPPANHCPQQVTAK